MFPNDDDFIDPPTINVFLAKNLVPALLGNMYYCLHTRHEKSRCVVLCCSPLLYSWILYHIPQKGTWKVFQKNLKWSQKLECGKGYYQSWGVAKCPSYKTLRFYQLQSNLFSKAAHTSFGRWTQDKILERIYPTWHGNRESRLVENDQKSLESDSQKGKIARKKRLSSKISLSSMSDKKCGRSQATFQHRGSNPASRAWAYSCFQSINWWTKGHDCMID